MPRGRPRLSRQQAAVYAAEAEALGDRGIRWRRVSEAQSYLDRLVGSEWFARRWPRFGPAYVERRGSGSTWSTCAAWSGPGADGGVIYLAELSQPVLLHELAHLLAGPGEGHSARFAETHLELVRQEMGFYAWSDYRHQLAQRAVGQR